MLPPLSRRSAQSFAPQKTAASTLTWITVANQHFRYIQLQEEYIKDEQRFVLSFNLRACHAMQTDG